MPEITCDTLWVEYNRKKHKLPSSTGKNSDIISRKMGRNKSGACVPVTNEAPICYTFPLGTSKRDTGSALYHDGTNTNGMSLSGIGLGARESSAL